MIYKLRLDNLLQLRKLPETGMGYQLIEAIADQNYVSKELVVFNGQIAIGTNALKYSAVLKAIIKDDYEQLLADSAEISLRNISLKSDFHINNNLASEFTPQQKTPAKDNQQESANGDELFVRLSAFEDDIRIDKQNKCLLPGSYTTTASDILKCKLQNADPIARYALPNEFEIKWMFYIEPLLCDNLQRGWTEPAFDKPGGGREVYFEKGSSRSTFIAQSQWPNEHTKVAP